MPATDNAWDVVPNLAVEVVSPTDNVEGLEQKIAEYFRAGVQLIWVVHPTRSKVHVYQSPTQITVLSKNDVLDGGTVVPGFKLAIGRTLPGSDGRTSRNEWTGDGALTQIAVRNFATTFSARLGSARTQRAGQSEYLNSR